MTGVRSISAALWAVALAWSLLLTSEPALTQTVPVPEGYRMSDYRAPVPDMVPGAITIDTEKLQALIAEGDTVLIDVLPRPPRPPGLSEGTVWTPKPRQSLPGAIWLPNVGFGALSDEMHDYFSTHLERLATEMPSARLVLYCEPNCWMSWNAAKRAVEWGYERIYWYPDGTVGWQAAGLPLESVEPAPPLK